MHKHYRIPNIFGEELDVIVSGKDPKTAKGVIVYVHGYGTDKNEGFASFLDLSDAYNEDFINVRFDLSGYGKSEGKDYKFSFFKATSDLKSILVWVGARFPQKPIYIIAHSMGTFVAMLAMPCGVKKFIFTGIVNSNTAFVSRWLKDRILSKGGIVDKQGISVYIRSSGAVQLIGGDFWKVLENFKPIEYLKYIARCSEVHIFKPVNDNVLPNKYFSEYKSLARELENILYYELPGDHNFTNSKHRKQLINKIHQILTS